jgi:hypothetical protein
MPILPILPDQSLPKDTAPDIGIPHTPDAPPPAGDWGDGPGAWGGAVPSWGTDTPGAVLPWGTDEGGEALRWGTDAGPQVMARACAGALLAGGLIALVWRLAALRRGLWG